MANITGVVITLNEAANIEACLASLARVCDELIVVDSGSTDETCRLAERAGARLIKQPYLGDGPQKNVGPAQASHRWVLSLDADERLTDEVVAAIERLDLEDSKCEAFSFRRRNHLGSRWIRTCGWYPDHCVRLFDRKRTAFSNSRQHASITASQVTRLDADIEHYSFANLAELFTKASGRFSTRAAKIMYLKGKRANSLSPFLHGANAFLRKYVFQRGFTSGLDGASIALSSAVNAYLKYAKLLELQRDRQVRDAEDFDRIW
ncbi:Glycosyltransferase involved in cell wall bisynthesis [Modicisalibacter ilicicola DSM 19980]|uniref:Glycosyltransferase involved in cell wall bisynthesis n=1 Tax=Modicisalibacter ilicicola DSM 19980 TaxID=1121942 RepID=A0A1M4VS69_9GAMM|nr:glycosyltransferase family 2 protein [Halomonas ilicicola]SHE71690.1 Glycosyltransferase involved in cell wall bisynthesis [Halomonas ilicicola DSM 19980]